MWVINPNAIAPPQRKKCSLKKGQGRSVREDNGFLKFCSFLYVPLILFSSDCTQKLALFHKVLIKENLPKYSRSQSSI